jgi:hypothetical protein
MTTVCGWTAAITASLVLALPHGTAEARTVDVAIDTGAYGWDGTAEAIFTVDATG